METFEFYPSGWWVSRLCSRNPLIRLSDRLEVLIVVLGVLLGLVAAAFAGALGTAVHDVRSGIYVEQAGTRHPVTATAIEDTASASDGFFVTLRTYARWHARDGERTGWVTSDEAMNAGDTLKVWVDSDGNQVAPPTPVSHAASLAIGVAVTTWLFVVAATVELVSAARSRLGRRRAADWDCELRHLVDDYGERPNR